MRYLYLLCCALFITTNIGARNIHIYQTGCMADTSYTYSSGTSELNEAPHKSPKVSLSDNPTSAELQTLFGQVQMGSCDIYDVLQQLADRKDNSLQGLAELLFTGDDKSQKKYYALHALEVIGTPKAYDLILQYGIKTGNEEHKAAALIMLTNSYYEKAANEELVPTDRILPLYEECASDTTFTEMQQRPIREMAIDGIKKWTGEEISMDPEKENKKRLSGTTKTSVLLNNMKNQKPSWDKEKKIFTFDNGGVK